MIDPVAVPPEPLLTEPSPLISIPPEIVPELVTSPVLLPTPFVLVTIRTPVLGPEMVAPAAFVTMPPARR